MRAADLSIARETHVDYEKTAELAAAAFEHRVAFSARYLDWLYNQSHSRGSVVLSVFDHDHKVGQIAMVRQLLRLGERREEALLCVDMFVLAGYRSAALLVRMVREIEKVGREEGIRFLLGVPNDVAARVTTKLWKGTPLATLSVRAGAALPLRSARVIFSAALSDCPTAPMMALFDRYLEDDHSTAVAWDGGALFSRLQGRPGAYGVHATDNLLAISSRRRLRRFELTLICGLFSRAGRAVSKADVRALVRAACALQGRPLFAYAGLSRLPLPGLPVPRRLRPTPMTLHFRDLDNQARPSFDRYEAIDFDFA